MTRKAQFTTDGDGALWFRFGELQAGAYQLKDSHKPYLHPVNTPAGYKLSLGRPHDHPHHKALMFALQTEDVNYWEEYPIVEGMKVGRQLPQGEPELQTQDNTLRMQHSLHWKADDGDLQIIEDRSLCCVLSTDEDAFIWEWESRLTPVVDVQLVKSPYVPEPENGSRINYHGLGIRLRREFGCTGGNEVRIGGELQAIPDALGRRTNSVSFRGSIDEVWPVPQCEITFSSPEALGVFVMDSPFAYLAYGPSVLDTPLWKADETRNFKFTIRVADIPPSL